MHLLGSEACETRLTCLAHSFGNLTSGTTSHHYVLASHIVTFSYDLHGSIRPAGVITHSKHDKFQRSSQQTILPTTPYFSYFQHSKDPESHGSGAYLLPCTSVCSPGACNLNDSFMLPWSGIRNLLSSDAERKWIYPVWMRTCMRKRNSRNQFRHRNNTENEWWPSLRAIFRQLNPSLDNNTLLDGLASPTIRYSQKKTERMWLKLFSDQVHRCMVWNSSIGALWPFIPLAMHILLNLPFFARTSKVDCLGLIRTTIQQRFPFLRTRPMLLIKLSSQGDPHT